MPSPISENLIIDMAERFKMLGDASRLRILRALMTREMNVTEIVESTGLSQANVSKHLRLLTSARMISRRKSGLNVFYSIADPVVQKLCDLVCRTVSGKKLFSRDR